MKYSTFRTSCGLSVWRTLWERSISCLSFCLPKATAPLVTRSICLPLFCNSDTWKVGITRIPFLKKIQIKITPVRHSDLIDLSISRCFQSLRQSVLKKQDDIDYPKYWWIVFMALLKLVFQENQGWEIMENVLQFTYKSILFINNLKSKTNTWFLYYEWANKKGKTLRFPVVLCKIYKWV